jgi:site-specific DNA-methyltransferase (adenine-specific)
VRIETIGNATLYCGDCLDILPKLPYVDAVITDPPYAVPTQVASGREVTRNVGDLSIVEAAMRLYLGEAAKRLTPKGRMFVFCDGTFYPVVFRALYGRFNTALLVWDKCQIGMGREFRKRHELIIHAWQDTTPVVSSEGVARADVLRFEPVRSECRIHPAQKPIELLAEFASLCGSVILDPFMGSGSTAIAALRTGRRFIGVEINEEYFDRACEHIAAIQGEKHVDESQAQQRLLA